MGAITDTEKAGGEVADKRLLGCWASGFDQPLQLTPAVCSPAAAVPAAPYPAAPAGTVGGPDVSSEEAVRARVVRSSATVPTLRPGGWAGGGLGVLGAWVRGAGAHGSSD